jgi:hypothetical protein
VFAHLREALPQRAGEKTHNDMRNDPVSFLMVDRTQLHIVCLYAKGRVCIGQLDMGLPSLYASPVLDAVRNISATGSLYAASSIIESASVGPGIWKTCIQYPDDKQSDSYLAKRTKGYLSYHQFSFSQHPGYL